ncbi:MAG: TetR/AcrR family transcriptional regulator [Salibacteraceae bacterium]
MAPRTTKQFEEIRTERRAQILDAALHVFAEEGYHTASVSKIAKRASISKGLMYNYFTSKEELLKTIVLEIFEEVMEGMDMKPGEVLTKEKFIHTVHFGIDIAVNNPHRWKLYVSLTFQPDVMPVIMAEMMPHIQPYMKSLSEYFGKKNYDDPIAMMRIYSAMVDGIQMHCILDPENFPVQKAKQLIIDQFA